MRKLKRFAVIIAVILPLLLAGCSGEGDGIEFSNTGGSLVRIVVPPMYDKISSYTNGYALVELKGKVGAINQTGDLVVPIEYEWLSPFSPEGLTTAKKRGLYGFLDSSGNIVIPFEYSLADAFNEGLAVVSKKGKYGYINSDGEIVIPIQYSSALWFSEGYAAVRENGKWGYIDETGRVVIACEYEAAEPFTEGLAAVRKNGKYGYIDTEGGVIVPFEYDYVLPMNDGVAAVRKGGGWGFVDSAGEVVLPALYALGDWDVAPGFVNGFAMLMMGVRSGYINRAGEFVIPFEYTAELLYRYGVDPMPPGSRSNKYYQDFHDGMVGVQKGNESGVLDENGGFLIELTPEIQYFQPIGYGLVMAAYGDRLAFMDAYSKEFITGFEFDKIGRFSEGLAAAFHYTGGWGFVNPDCEAVIPFSYAGADSFSEGYAAVMKDGKWGYITPDGSEAVPFIYESAGKFKDGYAVVSHGGKLGLLSYLGNE